MYLIESSFWLITTIYLFYILGKCTGDFVESDPARYGIRPPVGTKCIGPCIQSKERWGYSYCHTDYMDGKQSQWGAECVDCSSLSSNITFIENWFNTLFFASELKMKHLT